MNNQAEPQWHALPAEGAVQMLESSLLHGLSNDEARVRLSRAGRNVITQSRSQPWWLRLLQQLHTPLVYILLVAAVVTLWMGEYTDSIVIAAVLAINAIIGFVQESKAAKAIDALSRALHIEATVRRDGHRRRIDAQELVTGDIVALEAGDRVPADMRLFDHPGAVRDLHADESPLTGESAPVSKHQGALDADLGLADRRNMVYASTLITRGTAEGIVVATADATQVGQINTLIASADNLATPLTRTLAQLCNRLLWIILVIAALAFIAGMLRGNSAADMFKAAVAISVGAIPEGLPAAVTVMLAVGVSRMARRKAIIRKLPAVEALGSTTVICSDKTGTLTQNQMTVRAAWVSGGDEYEFTGAGYSPEGTVRHAAKATPPALEQHVSLARTITCGAWCNDAAVFAAAEGEGWKIRGDPTEAALLVAFEKLHTLDPSLTESPRLDAIAFESDRQYMATLHDSHRQGDQSLTVCVKGSVERVLAMCETAMSRSGVPEPLDKAAVLAAAAALASRGLRVLAMAERGVPRGTLRLSAELAEHQLMFLGLQGMLDPPREEARVAVAACQRAGIRVKMITGDHAITAATIAGMIGIEGASADGVITGAQMALLHDDALPEMAARTTVFARMTPEQKLRLVRALQRGTGGKVNIVAMTGDGVNDAPALRQADIGIAMGISGTEVAKDAADIVLADDNFASIKAAIEEGRSVYANLTKFIVWTLPTNGECLVIIAAIAMGRPLPILPVQALYINMVTAVLLGIPLIFEPKEPGIMEVPPRDPAAPLLTFKLIMRTGLVSLVLCIGAIAAFEWELQRGMSHAVGRTAAVSAIVAGEVFYLFSSRSLLHAAWKVPLFSNPWLWAGIGAMTAVQLAFAHVPFMNRLFHTAPLDAAGWLRVLCVGASVLIAVETEKAIRRFASRASGSAHHVA